MLSSIIVARRAHFVISAVDCREDRRRWAAEAERDDFRIVLVRQGRFRRRVNGAAGYVDPSMGYVGVPGEEEEFAHPNGGDRCTAIRIGEALWTAMAGEDVALGRSTIYVDAGLDLAHRRVLSCGSDVDFAMTEQLLGLLSGVLRQAVSGTLPSSGGARTDTKLVAMACEAIGAEHPASADLVSLATLLDVSPYRLSRVFSRRLGVTLTRYRNRVRVGRALDLIEEGATELAAVAARLGFADQAHLTRTVKQHYGHTPTALKRLITRSDR